MVVFVMTLEALDVHVVAVVADDDGDCVVDVNAAAAVSDDDDIVAVHLVTNSLNSIRLNRLTRPHHTNSYRYYRLPLLLHYYRHHPTDCVRFVRQLAKKSRHPSAGFPSYPQILHKRLAMN